MSPQQARAPESTQTGLFLDRPGAVTGRRPGGTRCASSGRCSRPDAMCTRRGGRTSGRDGRDGCLRSPAAGRIEARRCFRLARSGDADDPGPDHVAGRGARAALPVSVGRRRPGGVTTPPTVQLTAVTSPDHAGDDLCDLSVRCSVTRHVRGQVSRRSPIKERPCLGGYGFLLRSLSSSWP